VPSRIGAHDAHRPLDDWRVEMVAAATLYGLFSAWLLFPYFGVRRMLTTSAAVLTWAEFVAVLACGRRGASAARQSEEVTPVWRPEPFSCEPR
jgi:hypothetical protein